MKKPVILIIGVIYILAIAIVGFLGIKARVLNEKVYATDITLEFDERLTKKDPPENVDFYYTIPDVENTSFNITARVLPTNASNKQCTFSPLNDIDDELFYSIEENFNGESTIATIVCKGHNRRRTITLKVSTTDRNKSLYKIVWINLKA